MAKAQKGKAEVFIAEAEGFLSKKGWFSSSKERNAEEAAESFEKAANAYKIGGMNQDAGDAYAKAAALYRDRLSDFNHASKAFNNAGTNMNIISLQSKTCLSYRRTTRCIVMFPIPLFIRTNLDFLLRSMHKSF